MSSPGGSRGHRRSLETALAPTRCIAYHNTIPGRRNEADGNNPMRAKIYCRNDRGRRPVPVRRGGFSLLELLVVLALLLIILFMSREGFMRDRARKRIKQCAQNLAGQYVALQMYANDHEGWFPIVTNASSPSEPLALLIPKYTTQTEFWICPASGDRPLKAAQPFADRRISYAYYMGWRRDDPSSSVLASDEQVDSQPKLAQQVVFSTDSDGPGSNHGTGGGNFLRTDGSVAHSPSRAAGEFPLPAHVTLLNSPRK
jgi:prepilin-type N-terminal cleavage/methylation domain-containing protein